MNTEQAKRFYDRLGRHKLKWGMELNFNSFFKDWDRHKKEMFIALVENIIAHEPEPGMEDFSPLINHQIFLVEEISGQPWSTIKSIYEEECLK